MSEGFNLNIPESMVWKDAMIRIRANVFDIDDIGLRESLLKAVENERLIDLLSIVANLADEKKRLNAKIVSLENDVSFLKEKAGKLEADNRHLMNAAFGPKRTHRRKDYPIQRIIKTYEETGSLRKTAEICGADRGTIRSILIDCGVAIKK